MKIRTVTLCRSEMVTLNPFLPPFSAFHSRIRRCDSQLTPPTPPPTTHKPTTIQITKNQTHPRSIHTTKTSNTTTNSYIYIYIYIKEKEIKKKKLKKKRKEKKKKCHNKLSNKTHKLSHLSHHRMKKKERKKEEEEAKRRNQSVEDRKTK